MTEKSFFAGFGGQGIISLGQIWGYCGMKEGKNVSFFPFYGAEKRGGIARAGVIVSDEEIALVQLIRLQQKSKNDDIEAKARPKAEQRGWDDPRFPRPLRRNPQTRRSYGNQLDTGQG